jgi:hypothetical protein
VAATKSVSSGIGGVLVSLVVIFVIVFTAGKAWKKS